MRILVTGHQGYIGPVVVRLLQASGHDVAGLDTGYFSDCLAEGLTEPRPDSTIRCDVRQVGAHQFEGIDAVVYLAALSNDPLGEIVASQTHDINVAGMVRAAEFARAAGVRRFVFASSCSIYGAAGGASAALDETAPFAPVSAYAKSKVDGEAGLRALADGRFRPIFLRNATAFGVSPRMRLDLVLNNLSAWAHTTGVVRLLSDGKPWRPMVHIEDIALGVKCALTASDDELVHDTFNIGMATCNYRVLDIAEVVARTIPGCSIEVTGQTSNDPRSYRVDFSRALNQLPGFAPRWTLEAGAAEIRDWISPLARDVGHLLARRYVRIDQMKHLRAAGLIDDSFYWTGR